VFLLYKNRKKGFLRRQYNVV